LIGFIEFIESVGFVEFVEFAEFAELIEFSLNYAGYKAHGQRLKSQGIGRGYIENFRLPNLVICDLFSDLCLLTPGT
jgi:hypothetical protein